MCLFRKVLKSDSPIPLPSLPTLVPCQSDTTTHMPTISSSSLCSKLGSRPYGPSQFTGYSQNDSSTFTSEWSLWPQTDVTLSLQPHELWKAAQELHGLGPLECTLGGCGWLELCSLEMLLLAEWSAPSHTPAICCWLLPTAISCLLECLA